MKKDNLEAIYPLSPMQEGMLFHSLYAPQLEVYFEQFAYTLHGDLNIPAFKEAWRQIVALHPALRTLFLWEGQEKPLQVVRRQVELPWSEQDWRDIPAGEQRERIQAWLQTDRVQGFDLTRAPLLRLNLFRLDKHVYHFTWSFHHLLLDGWSVFTVMSQVFTCYEALRQRRPVRLPASRPYRDYIGWLRQQSIAQAEAFWREQLRGFTTPTPLVIEQASLRGFEPVGDYHNQQIRLSEAFTAQLQQLARQQKLTLNTLIQGAWGILLSRYCGQQDVVFGTTVSGRPAGLAGVEAMIGLFINTLPLRARIEPQRRLLPWLQEMQDQQVEARQYEYSPLVQVQGWSEVPRGQPLFDHLLIFASYPADTSFIQKSSLSIEQLQVIERTNYPFTVSVTPFASMLIRVSYAHTHFTHESIQRLLGHLQTLLEAMVADPEQRISSLPLLTKDELQQQLYDWNATQAAYPREKFLPALFEEQVERNPDAIALVFDDAHVTYGELNARANQLARHVRHLGVAPEVCVGLCLERSIEMLIGMLAILKAGGAYVPLDPAYPLERLTLMMQETQAPVLLTQQSLLPSLQAHNAQKPPFNVSDDGIVADRASLASWPEQIICLDRDWPLVAREDACNIQSELTATSLAYVIYTSGSTGRPKGTLVEHKGLANLVAAQVQTFAIEPASRVLQFASLSFDAAVSEIFTTLLRGAALLLEPREALFPGPGLIRRLDEQAVSVVTLPPSVLSALPAAHLPALRTLVVAGSASSATLVERWAQGRRFLNAYGPTEASVCATIAHCEDGNQTPPIGRPIANVQVYVLDRFMRPVPVGVVGELSIASVGLARGYLQRPALTAECFVPNPFNPEQAGSRLYHTGDLVRYLSDGQIEYVGRQDGQVKVRGYRIEVGEIEAVFSRHPAIREVVVLARAEQSTDAEPTDKQASMDTDRRLVAYLVAQPGVSPTTSELRTYLLRHLPEYMVPAVYLWLDAMPCLPNGKVDRRALPAPGDSRPVLEKAYRAPGTPLEQYLADVWKGLLKLDEIGIHDNFFELGGDSIKAAMAINKVQERFGVLVYAVALFDAPTIAKLASYLAEQYTETVSKLFGQESLPAAVTAAASLKSSHGTLVDLQKVQLLRQVIAPLAPFSPEPEPIATKNPPAVFVLSPPRSGSTLLRVMLAGHPQLFAPPELELLSFQTLGERFAAFAGRNAFWLEGLVRAVMEIKNCDVEAAQQLLADYEARNLPTQEFYRLLQEWLGGQLLVDKTPAYALDLAILQRAEQEFREARYIHLVRHPRAMIRSFEAARLDQVFFRHAHTFSRRELAELIWVVCQQNIQAFLNEVPRERQLQISFEALVHEPQQAVEDICQFLGIAYHPAMLEPYQGDRMTDGIRAHSKMIGDIKFHEHQGIDATVAEQWKEQQAEDNLGEVTWQIAASLGYQRSAAEDADNGAASPGTLSPIRARTDAAGGAIPLSYAQKRLWFLDQWEPQSAVYNMYSILHLEGGFEVSVLERSLNEIVRRHSVLRTSFQTVDGQPTQVSVASLQVPLLVVDLGELPPAQHEGLMQDLALELVQAPFDLSRSPLLRTMLLRVQKAEHFFLLTMHHSISDGWSMSVFNRELVVLYEAFSQGQPSPLPALPIQYSDYTLWQHQELAGPGLQSQLAYWQQQLAQLTPLTLPTDHVRPARQRFQGSTFRFRLSQQLTAALKLLSRREGVTLFMLTLAGFQVLLSRYSGQSDIVVGTPIANRGRSEIEDLIGPFVNTLVLRVDLSGNLNVHELLAKVRRLTSEAYAHQELPFDTLVEALNPERSLSHHPLFQVMFSLHNTPATRLTLPGVQIQLLDVETKIAHFDLSLNLYDEAGGLIGDIEYDRDLFEEETIARMSKHYERLLAAMTAYPETQIAAMSLLTDAERAQFRAWNATKTEDHHDLSLPALFEAQVERAPDAIALVFEEQCLSYRELDSRANQLTRYLRLHYEIQPEHFVALVLDRSPALLIGILGILKAGAAYVPLDPDYPQQRLAFVLQEIQAPVVLTLTSLLERLPEHKGATLCLDRAWKDIALLPASAPGNRVLADSLAYTIYTSGSTGRPKGVQISHRALVNFLSSMRVRPGLSSAETLLAVTSISFDIAGLELFLPLLVGARLVLASYEVSRDGERLGQLLTSSGAQVMQATPTTWRLLLEAGWRCREGIHLLCGGEALPVELARTLIEQRAELWNMYGPTETTIWSTIYHVERVEGNVPIGRPIANTQIYLLDARLQPVPIGVAGELYIGGSGLSRGYLHRPDLTAERFLPDPFSLAPGVRLYHTGDLARFQPDGNLEILGRLDTQIKMWGYRIELGEIEATLARHPLVTDAIVVLREDEPGEKRLVAYVVPHQENAPPPEGSGPVPEERSALSSTDLRGYVSERLPAYMVPAAVVSLAELPLLPNGKVDRRGLSASDGAGLFVPEREPDELDASEGPRTAIEEQLVAIWSQLLRLERVGIHAHFFKLGGHSLLATQVISRVRAAFNINLPLQSLFVAPTIADMARAIEEQQREQRNASSTLIHRAEQGDGELLLEQLDQLSDEEMEALFDTLITEEEIKG